MRLLATLVVLLATAAGAGATTASVTFDSIAIAYDPARWEVIVRPTGALFFGCRGSGCRVDDRSAAPGVTVSRSKTGAPSAEEIARWSGRRDALPLWESFASGRTYGGVRFVGYREDSRCRAYVPSMLTAIGTLGARHFAFTTGFNAGCFGRRGVNQERFEALLKGVRALEDAAK